MSANLRRLPRRRATGFTIIELMIAMLLGLIVIGGVLGVVLIMLQTSRTNTALSEVQSSTRLAFEMMAHDIRTAQLTGCGNSSTGRVANVLNQQTDPAAWWADWNNNALIGHDHTQTDSAVPRVANTDSIMVLGADDTGMSVNSNNSTAGQFIVNGDTGGLQAGGGDVLIVCDPDHATIFQTASVTPANPAATPPTANGTVTYDATSNCATGLGFPGACPGGGPAYTFGPNSQIAPLSAADWYVGTSQVGDGSWSLYRMALGNAGGSPAPAAQEMVRNVTGMTITYLPSGSNDFVTADQITKWDAVTAVQVQVQLQSNAQQRPGTDAKPIARTYTTTIALYNRID